MSAWEPSSFLLVIAVVGLAIFRLWKMAMDNEEPVAGGSCGQQLSDMFSDIFRRRKKDDTKT